MTQPSKKSSSSSSDSSSSEENQPKFYLSQAPAQKVQATNIIRQPQQVIYQQQVGQTLSALPTGVTEDQVRRSLAGISLDIVKGEVRQEYIPMTRIETEYKEEVLYEKVPRQIKVTDFYQVEYQQEMIPQVYQHTITEYVPLQKIIPIVNYKALEKTYTRPEIVQGDVRIEQGAPEIVSSQIIQTQSQAYQTVPLPQVQTSGFATQIINPVQSISSSFEGQRVINYQVQQPIQMQSQFRQVGAYPQIPVQRSYHYAQTPIQTIQTVQAVPQIQYQPNIYQQAVIGAPQAYQPGLSVNNFQGVRLTDSHILMK